MLLTTTKLIRGVPTVINVITHLGGADTLLIGTTELIEDAWSRPVGTDGHVIFIRPITTVVNSITFLIEGNAFVVVALEPP